ncbi:MAG: ABC transporter ATP-binding protein [Dehalococcoidia bacterium]|nr:ABC transporter ATP-binding protein [Dehalococcoidia bacterium]
MLNVVDVQASYGPVLALQDISLSVPKGGIVSVLGANGAGKTSTLRAISGLLRATQGTIEFDGRRIERLSPEQIVQMGISQVPEGRQIFSELSVIDNLRLGAYTRRDGDGVKRDIERVFSYFPVLGERRRQEAGLLSGGEQQMLAIGRALMARPKLLLLDEPSLGLAPMLVREIFRIIKAINQDDGLTILLVEQDANLALGIAQHGYVLETGRVVLEDAAEHLRANESVRRSYLGY